MSICDGVAFCVAGIGWAILLASFASAASESGPPLNISSRLELFVDDWLIEKLTGAELRLNEPTPREVAVTFDKPWEGNTSAYVAVFQDDDRFRMYYRGSHHDWKGKKSLPQVVCYAESKDGLVWTKPELGVCEFEGSKANSTGSP